MIKAADTIKKLKAMSSPARAKILQRFFKTGPGEYGAGDIFLGLTVPQVRGVVKQCRGLSLEEVVKLLHSPYHEVRLAGAFCLVERTHKADLKTRRQIYKTYLSNRSQINNWDLVDLSAPKIVGEYLLAAPNEKKILDKLSNETNMWSRRIAILATFAFIRAGDLRETFKLAKKYLADKEDLMHKATGWMLREAGKRDEVALKNFLLEFYRTMPRTMLRYAIEKFPPHERQYFLKLPSLRARAKQSPRRAHN